MIISNCNDSSLMAILGVVKNILFLIQIVGPILLVISAAFHIFQLVKNPEDKKGVKKVINAFTAAIIIFMIPVLINAFMVMLGEDTNFSSCWLNANEDINYADQYMSTSDKNNSSFLEDSNSYEKGVKNSIASGKLDYSSAREIPDSVLKNARHSDLSIVIASEDGVVLASRKPDLLREGGSTYKVFTGYSAVKLLDPKSDVVVSTQYAQNMPYMGSPDVKVGQKFSVSAAATRDFPGSSNITTANIAIAIGKKHSSVSSDEDAYFKGMELINKTIKEAGCTKSNLQSSSGVNYNYKAKKFVGNKNGISTGEYGITASDLVLITTLAMQDENFSKGINYGSNGICPPPDKDSFFIKSGTQSYCHGIWGFNYKGERYYIGILGVNCKNGDNKCTIFKDLYNWAKSDLIK